MKKNVFGQKKFARVSCKNKTFLGAPSPSRAKKVENVPESWNFSFRLNFG